MATTPDGDNRWTAILSTDLAGFTEISQALGAERVYELLTVVLGLARSAIEENDGTVVDTAGDGVLAAFGAPQAVENAALSACRAALAFQEKLDAERAKLEADFRTSVQFRTGISVGNVMVARMGDNSIKVVGDAVNTVARLQALALPNETLMSDTVRRETEGHIEALDIGQVTLKGFPEPVRVHKLQALGETVTKFDGTRRRGILELVGRKAELDKINVSLRADSRQNIVLLRGAAGIGKSRLAHEISENSPRRSFVGQCQPSGRPPAYHPFVEIFRQATGAEWGAGNDAILTAIVEQFPDLRRDALEIGSESKSRDRMDRTLRLQAFYRKALQQIAGEAPTLFVLEDLHWIDPASEALLTSLLDTGLSFLLTARSEFDADWQAQRNVLALELDPLQDTDIVRIAAATLSRRMSPRVADFVTQKAEGVPLVAEEISRALLQDELLTLSADGADLPNDPGTLLTGQLEQLVLSRVDRLASAQQETIKFAAAIGRDFAETQLTQALGRPPELDRIAERPGLIEKVGTDHWRFVHALIRDAVYASLLAAHRRETHLKIAQAMETAPGFDASQSGTVAEHFLQSTEPARAAALLVQAAGHSLGTYALIEIDQMLSQAYQLHVDNPGLLDEQTFGNMTVYWLRAMDYLGNFKRGLDLSERLLPQLEKAGYSPALSISRVLTVIALTHAWKYDEARIMADTALQEAERQNDPWGAAWAKLSLMRIADETKNQDIHAIEKLCADILPVAAETDDRQMAMTAQYLLSSAYRTTGQRKKALKQAEKIEAYSVTHKDRRALGYAIWARGLIHAAEGNPELAFAAIKDARTTAIPGSGDARVNQGLECFCRTFLDDPALVRQQIDDTLREARDMADRNIEGSMAFTSATNDLRAGRLARGWRNLNALRDDIGPKGNVNLLQQVYAAKTEILLTLAGLIHPDDEAPPDRAKPPRTRPGIADLVTFARLRFRALKLTEDTIATSRALSRTYANPHDTRFQIALGLIRAAQKQPDIARQLLTEGLASAEKEGFDLLANRARKALHDL